MTPNRRRFMKYLAKLFDLCALTASTGFLLIVFSLPRGMTLADFMAIRIRLGNGLAFALLIVMWHYLFISCGLYVSKRLTTPLAQVLEVCRATTLAAAVLFVTAKAFHLLLVRPTFVLVFWLSI